MKNYRRLLISFVTAAIALSVYSCKKSDSDGPLVPEELKPGRRDYTWTADTTKPMPFNSLYRMWGDKDDNIWAVGGAGDFDKAIWHYDGNKWSRMPNHSYVDPTCVFGFDKNTVWIGGTLGKFWKYDGYSWTKTDELTMEKYPQILMENMWGESPENIYACGAAYQENNPNSRAVLMHYDGKNWSVVNTPEMRGEFFDIAKDIKGSGLYFIQNSIWDPMGPDSNKVFIFDGVNMKEIYSCGKT